MGIIVQPVHKDQRMLGIVDLKFRKGINNNINGKMPNVYMATDGELEKFEPGKVACVGFRYRRQSHHCNTPDAPVWMGDYTFKPMGEVQIGDEVIGFEWVLDKNGRRKKKLVKTRVLATQRRVAPEVVKITMSSGRVIKCTPDHKWLRGTAGGGITSPYFEAKVGKKLVHVIDVPDQLKHNDEYLALS